MRWFSRVVRSVSSLLRRGEETRRLTRELEFQVGHLVRLGEYILKADPPLREG